MSAPANIAKKATTMLEDLQIHAEYDAYEAGPRWMVFCRAACGWGAFADEPAAAHANHLSDVAKSYSRHAT